MLVLVVPAAANEVGRVRRALADFLLARGVPSAIVDDVQLVASELATNAVMYGRGISVEVVAELADDIRLVVSNDGSASAIPPIDAWRLAAPLAISGRGLGIVRRLSDHIEIHDRDGRAIVEVRRGLPAGGPD